MAARNRYATFRLDGQWHGIAVECVQEVLPEVRLTKVPLGPPGIAGLLNLRGEIVVAWDMRRRLGRAPRADGAECVHVVARSRGDVVSLVVDEVCDVIDIGDADVATPPPSLPAELRAITSGVVAHPDGLLLILDLARATAS